MRELPTPPSPGTRVPPVIEAVAIGRGLVDEADVHIIGNVFGSGCTIMPSRRPRSSERARRGGTEVVKKSIILHYIIKKATGPADSI